MLGVLSLELFKDTISGTLQLDLLGVVLTPQQNAYEVEQPVGSLIVPLKIELNAMLGIWTVHIVPLVNFNKALDEVQREPDTLIN